MSGALPPMLKAPPALVVNASRTPGSSSTGGRPSSACSAHSFESRSRPKTAAAVPNSQAALRTPRVTALPTGLRLSVLDAQVDVGKGLDAGLLDRLAAPVAQAVGPGVHTPDRAVDLREQIADVVLDRQVPLPLEGGRAGVGRFVVERDL